MKRKPLLTKMICLLLICLLLLINCMALTACTTPQNANEKNDPEPQSAAKKITYCYDLDGHSHLTQDAVTFEANVPPQTAIEVVFSLNYTIPKCDCPERSKNAATKQDMDAIQQAHRAKLKELHTAKNNEFVESTALASLQDYGTLTVAEYSPYVVLLLNDYEAYKQCKDTILSCAANVAIDHIDITPSYGNVDH